jgi:type II secretory pathway pseudopilin PulG
MLFRGSFNALLIAVAILGILLLGMQLGISRGRHLQERDTFEAELRAASLQASLQECRAGCTYTARKEWMR